jgi:hypothetical protein
MREYSDYIKTETDKDGILWHWIETPLFKLSFFEQQILERYEQRLNFVVKNDKSKEAEIEFIKEEIEEIKQLIKTKPTYDPIKLCFAQRISGDCYLSDDTIDEFKEYFEKYRNYKYYGFMIEFLGKRLIEIENRTIQNNGVPISNTKLKKIAEKWHALHYWLELTAHGKKTPVDCYGSFEKSELEQIGAKRCNSTGQGFYREFTKIDINNPIILKRIFGNEWKSTIIKLCENDIVTVDYINLKYK